MLILGGCATLVNPQKIVEKKTEQVSGAAELAHHSFGPLDNENYWRSVFFSQRHISRYHHGWLIQFQVAWNISIADHSIWNQPF